MFINEVGFKKIKRYIRVILNKDLIIIEIFKDRIK